MTTLNTYCILTRLKNHRRNVLYVPTLDFFFVVVNSFLVFLLGNRWEIINFDPNPIIVTRVHIFKLRENIDNF